MKRFVAIATLLLISVTGQSGGADLLENFGANEADGVAKNAPTITARAVVIGGDTLWFPEMGVRMRLDGIEACSLPQWAFNPSSSQALAASAPVPCGAMAKAWLRRLVGNSVVNCAILRHFAVGEMTGRCFVRGRDLAFEMLRIGWARTVGPRYPEHLAAERYARSARYGLWGTYLLEMAEWQRKAIDRTTARRPIADWNLLAEREREFTPPFVDWRNRPHRTDR